MNEIKSIVWGLVILLVLYLWISSGCRNRWDQFRERRDQWREDRQEQREEREERWRNWQQRESIIDRWKRRREGA
jgi:hypothetical protein